MAYVQNGWIAAFPTNDVNENDKLALGIRRGDKTRIDFVGCKLCTRYTTLGNAMIQDWHITEELVIYCPDCKELI